MDKEYITMLYEIRKYAGEQYDKLIVYLSSGALTLTVGFVDKIVDLSKMRNFSLLYFSWIGFSVSLIIILISHRTSLLAVDLGIKGKERVSNIWNTITEIFNWISLISLILGIISFIIFVKAAFSIQRG